ncbi:hypothetical protein PIB30_085602, partial [Stylosanthes scabra]|nr:hypothetical protein [Stylosanthes scabra]
TTLGVQQVPSPLPPNSHGGFGSVHKATIPFTETVALKLRDSSCSLQGERELHNEFSPIESQLTFLFLISISIKETAKYEESKLPRHTFRLQRSYNTVGRLMPVTPTSEMPP